jgi:DNA replication protein DnaD
MWMENENTEGEGESLAKLLEDTMGKIEIRLNRKMTADDANYVYKWMGEYHFGMEIIDQAFMQSWGYGRVNIDVMDAFMIPWHENNLWSVAQIRTFEKEQGRKVF